MTPAVDAPRPPAVARLAGHWDVLLLGALSLCGHIAIRNYARYSLNGEMSRLDLGVTFYALNEVLAGKAIYSEIPWSYGPYWVAYYTAVLQVCGQSLGGLRWGLAALTWLHGMGVYVLVRHLSSRRWAAVALVASLAQPTLNLGVPYSSHMAVPVMVFLIAAVVIACRPRAPARYWMLVGVLLGVLFSVRVFSGMLAVAAVGLVWSATGRLHPPGRVVGPLPGMILAPMALLLATARLLTGYGLAFCVALGVPAVACALLAARAGWDQRDEGPATWRAWLAPPGWCAVGIIAGVVPWLGVLGARRGFGTALYDVYVRPFTEYALTDFTGEGFRNVGIGAPAWPTGSILAVLVLGGIALGGHLLLPRARRPGLLAVLGCAAGLFLLGDAWRLGSGLTVSLLQSARLWLLPGAYAAWALHVAWYGRRTDDPAWLIPLACVTGVVLFERYPGDIAHVAYAQGVMLPWVVAMVAHGVRHLGHRRVYRFAVLGPAGVALAGAVLLEVSALWWAWPAQTWSPLRKPLAWLDAPRGRVWDLAPSAQSLEAHLAYLDRMLAPGDRLFSFPDPFLLTLSGSASATPDIFFMPGLTIPDVDTRTAAVLRNQPATLVAVRLDARASFSAPDRLRDTYPEIFAAIEDRYEGIRRIDTVYYYVPRAQSPAP